ncbi:MAG: PA14 domain-containing protein, partial [Lentisphaeraceae bacterium]|nr:PA14 domain-containing protein [Lentisphaeraceae bacterium]
MSYLKSFLIIVLLALGFTALATDTGPTNPDDCKKTENADPEYPEPKRTCKNNTITTKNPECCDCNNAGTDTGGTTASYIDIMTYSYVHDAVDFQVEKGNPACTTCGGSAPSSSVPTLKLERFHKYREMSTSGSFGPGVFSNFDKRLTLYEVNGKVQIDYSNGTDTIMRRYFLQNGVFVDTFTRSTDRLELYNEANQKVTDLGAAVTAKIFDFHGEVLSFQIFEEDELTKAGRLVSELDRRGYGIHLLYEISDPSEDVSNYLSKYKIATAKDNNNRVLSFSYLADTKAGGFVVSSVKLPNTSSIIYNYESGSDGKLESVDYPDGTQSTFILDDTNPAESVLAIFESGDQGTHRNKRIHLDNNFVAGTKGREGIEYFNSSSLLVNAVELGDEADKELAFEVLQASGANGRRVYEGGNMLRHSDIISKRYFTTWTVDPTKGDSSKYTGSQESTFEHGDFKFYSGNAQHRMPIKIEENGLKNSYVYNSRKAATKKLYPDGSAERWTYNQFNQKTRYRDRLGRVTRYFYDDQGNIEKKVVGLRAKAIGSVGDEVTGLLCQVYDHTKTVLPTNFESLIPVETVSVPNLTLDVSDREDTYALLFTGEIEIRNAGAYKFFLSSDDGSKLYIDGVEIIDNDGLHGLKELTHDVDLELTEGKHSIRVEFFEKYGAQKLFLKYQGPDSEGVKVTVPDLAYSHEAVAESLQEEDVTTEATATYLYTYYPNTGSEELNDNRYLLHTETDALGNVTEYIYNDDNQLLVIKTPRDDGAGQIPKVTYDYDEISKRLKSSEDAIGRKTHFLYDNRDRIKRITYNDSSTELFFYGLDKNANLLIRKKDRNGNTTKFEYDSQGRAKTTIRAYSYMDKNDALEDEDENDASLQSLERCTYLQGTNLKKTCTIDGDLTEYFYDYRNRLVETRKHADNNSVLVSKSSYEKNLPFFREDPYGRRTYNSYRLDSDAALVRTVQETVPSSVSATKFSHVDNLERDLSNNADYLITDFDKDAEQQTTFVTDPRGIVHQTVYDFRGRSVLQISDVGEDTEEKDFLNQTRQTIYDANSNVIGVINPRFFEEGVIDGTVMTYTKRNLLKTRTVAKITGQVVSGDQATESFTYYDDGRAHTHTDFKNKTAETVWHECCGRLQANIDREGNVQVSNNDYFGNVTHTAVVDKDATITNYHNLPANIEGEALKTLQEVTTRFDARHRPIARTVWLQSLGVVNPNDVPIATDPTQGLTTTYEYFDEATGVSAVAELLGKLPTEVTLGALSNGSAVITTNPEGEKSAAIMDGAGRTVASGMISSEDGGLVTWRTVTHDNVVDNLLETVSTSAEGFENKSYTDGAGRRIKKVDAKGETSKFFYDANSNLVSFRDANDVGQDCIFDGLNRDVECTDTFGDTVKKSYDLNNNLIVQTDAKNKTTVCEFDDRNRKTSCTDRINGTTSYGYDDNNNLETITDALGKETNYGYDDRNLQIQVTYADHVDGTSKGEEGFSITRCAYDGLGRKSLSTDQKGEQVEFIYDPAGRLIDRVYYFASANAEKGAEESRDEFTYDKASRPLSASKGRYSNAVTFVYDDIGRTYSETVSTANSTSSYTSTNLKFDDDSRLEELQYPSGNKVVKTYTERNQLKSLDFNSASIVSEFKYDSGMREFERNFGNGLKSTRAYRAEGSGEAAKKDNLLASVAVSGTSGNVPELGFTYDYDKNKNVTQESTAGVTTGYSWNSTFDDIDRLDIWERTGNANSVLPKKQDWSLDKIGNWNDVTTDSVFEDRSHNDVHELSSINGSNLGYDLKGNLVTIPGSPDLSTTLTWDIDNHLTSYTKNANTTTFTYDAFGRRLEKRNFAKNTLFVSNGQQVVEEYESVGTGSYVLARSYVYGTYIDDVIAKVEAVNTPTVLFYHSDRQFNVRSLTDSSGNIKELYAYSPYGKQVVLDALGAEIGASAFNNNYGFTG